MLRLWAIDLAPFGYDEVDVLGRSRAVLGGELTATGPLTSWGIPDPPVSVYLMVPPSTLPHPAVAAAAWVAVLNVAAVVLTYVMARRFLGLHVALAAGLLFAVNPWAVYFSRRTWAEIVPLFSVLALWAAFEVVARRAWWAGPFFLALALQVNTRILALVYAPSVVLTLVLFPRRWTTRWSLLGIALGVLVSLPYLGWVGLHWQELQTRLAEGNRGLALPTEEAAGRGAGELLLWTAAGYGLLPLGSSAVPWLNPLGFASTGVLWTVAALLLVGVALAARAFQRRSPGWEPIVLSVVWLLPAGALAIQSSSVYLHYMVALFPMLFLVAAVPLAALLRGWRPLSLLGGALLASICAVQVATTAALYLLLDVYDPNTSASVAERQTAAALPREAANLLATGERYGVEVPLRFWQELADRICAEATQNELDEVWIVAGATDPLTAERPALLDYLLRPRLRPHFLAQHTLVFPVQRAALFVEAPDVDPAESLERFGARRDAVSIPSTNRSGRDLARLTLVPARSVESWVRLPPSRTEIGFEGGVTLLGFRAPPTARAGETVPIVTYWRLPPDLRDIPIPTLVLRDEAGQRSATSGRPPQLPPPTPGGEHIVVWRQDLQVPSRATAGGYRLAVGVADTIGNVLRRASDDSADAPLAPVRISAR